MEESETEELAFDLPKERCLLLLTQDPVEASRIASEVHALLEWVGAPTGFTVHLWWRHDPRQIKATQWPDKRTVNGGWAIPGQPNVYVYRSEEYDRVLLHETIHAMEWDWQMPEKPLPCWGLGEDASVQPALFEAWTELYAEWLWCGWHNQPWDLQREWQDYQATQILARAPPRWTENTNIFAYYILKAALAPHIAFLWVFGNGITEAERQSVLCQLVEPELLRLRTEAVMVEPEALSMCMTKPYDKK